VTYTNTAALAYDPVYAKVLTSVILEHDPPVWVCTNITAWLIIGP
jgi:hypothetical protein